MPALPWAAGDNLGLGAGANLGLGLIWGAEARPWPSTVVKRGYQSPNCRAGEAGEAVIRSMATSRGGQSLTYDGKTDFYVSASCEGGGGGNFI